MLPGLKLYSETLSKHRQQKNSGAKHFFFFFLHQHAWEDILWVLASLKLVAGRSCHLLFPDLLCYLLFLLLCLVPKFVQLLATPWTAACQALLSFIISWSLLGFMYIELVLLSSHFTLCRRLLLLPSIFSSIRVFPSELALCIRWPK